MIKLQLLMYFKPENYIHLYDNWLVANNLSYINWKIINIYTMKK